MSGVEISHSTVTTFVTKPEGLAHPESFLMKLIQTFGRSLYMIAAYTQINMIPPLQHLLNNMNNWLLYILLYLFFTFIPQVGPCLVHG